MPKDNKAYKLKQGTDVQKVIYGMRLIINWQTMRMMCLNRTKCEGCQFYVSGMCRRITTEQVLKIAREIFIENIEIE